MLTPRVSEVKRNGSLIAVWKPVLTPSQVHAADRCKPLR